MADAPQSASYLLATTDSVLDQSTTLISGDLSNLYFGDGGAQGTYTLNAGGAFNNFVNPNQSGLYVKLADGSLVNRALTGSASITIDMTAPANPVFSLIPNSTPQLIDFVNSAGSLIGERYKLNLIEGSNVDLTVVDNPSDDSIDITVNGGGIGEGVTSITLNNTDGFILFSDGTTNNVSSITETGGSPTINIALTDFPISAGGTDASSKEVAFNNLAPAAPVSSLIYYNGTHNVVVSSPQAGQLLQVSAGLPTWTTINNMVYATGIGQLSTPSSPEDGFPSFIFNLPFNATGGTYGILGFAIGISTASTGYNPANGPLYVSTPVPFGQNQVYVCSPYAEDAAKWVSYVVMINCTT